MDFPVNIPLKRPIIMGGETHSALSFDEPDLGTNLAVEEANTPGEQTILLLAGMAGVDRSVIVKVKDSDFEQIAARVLEPYQEMQLAKIKARGGPAPGNGEKAK